MMLLANLRDVVFIPSLFLLFLSFWHGMAQHGTVSMARSCAQSDLSFCIKGVHTFGEFTSGYTDRRRWRNYTQQLARRRSKEEDTPKIRPVRRISRVDGLLHRITQQHG
jgi:hypothetical protein